jgi:hypothetical protein
MADFAIWVTAAEPALGWIAGTFVRAYDTNRSDANDLALEASVLAAPLRAFVEKNGTWEGTATELVRALDEGADEASRSQRARQQEWPKNGHALSGALRRLAPNLRAVGVTITFHKTKKRRGINLTWAPPPDPNGGIEGENSVTCVTAREGASASSPGASPDDRVRHPFHAWGDAGDAGDADMGDHSAWGREEDDAETGDYAACTQCGALIAHQGGGYELCADCVRLVESELDMECPK